MKDIDRWIEYCSGTEHEVSEFYTLLMEITPTELRRIIYPLQDAKELYSRFLSLYEIKHLGKSNLTEVKELISKDLEFKKNILKEIDDEETLADIENAEQNFVFVKKDEYKTLKESESSWLETELISIIGQEFIFTVPSDNKRITNALSGPIYEVSSDYNMVWYLLAPLAGHMFKASSHYIELWDKGIEYFMTDSDVVVLENFV